MTPTPRQAPRPARPARAAQPAPDPTAQRREAKRQRRDEQLAARQRLEEQERKRRQLMLSGGIALGLLALVWLGWWLFGPDPYGARSVPIQGQEHIQRGQSHPPYNTKPATSGWHYGDAVAPWGVSKDPIADEVQVHNLEHGGVMVQYDCPDGCPEIVSKLEAIGRSYASKVIVAPYPGIGRKIALTAWGRIAYLDDVDEQYIRTFIQRYKNKAPERVPD